MIVTNPAPISPTQLYLLATATVDANALATTTLAWQNGCSAANSAPICARIARVSGTLALLVGTLGLNGTTLQAISAVQSALMGSAADPVQYPISSAVSAAVVPLAGSYQFTVGTINGAAASIAVSVYGFRLS